MSSSKYGRQLICFLYQLAKTLSAYHASIAEKFQPKYEFVSFLHDNPDLRGKLCLRTGATGSPIVRSDRRP